jgi:very-short-patch-repair endonuclease
MATIPKPKKRPKIPAYPRRDLYSKILEARLGVECLAELPFHPKRKWRFDYAFPSVKVAVEIDGGVFTGGRHSGGMGQKRDFEKMNAAAEMGWAVLHYLPSERMEGRTMLQILNTINERRGGNGKED